MKNNYKPKDLGSKGFLILGITLLVLVNLAVFFNIPILRQILGFLFLTFLPGLLILFILKLNKLGLVEKIVLSVGLSVAFCLLFGLAVNGSLLAIGYTKPLSIVPLVVSFSLVTVILAIIAYTRNKGITFSFSNFKLTTREKAFLIVPALFPLLSIVGMRIMNLTDNNVLLMVLLFLIPAYVIFVSFYRSQVPQRLYLSLIYLISISLLLMLSLRSNHITGSDIHDWYYAFQITLDNLHWSVLGLGIIDACLSISLLPAIYQIFLNINPDYLFKILYPLLFSISPLVVYIIAKKYIDSFYALLASFFFMAQFMFLWAAASSNTNMAILFFALAIMVLFHDGISELNRRLLFIVFTASSIVAHYSTAYIFLLVLILVWIGMLILPRFLYGKGAVSALSGNPATKGTPPNSPIGKTPLSYDADASQSSAHSVSQLRFKTRLTITSVVLFFVMLFFWYSQITAAAFGVGVGIIYKTLVSLNEWYLLEAKGPTIAAAVGEGIYMLPQQIRVVFSWLTIAFIAIGVLSTMARYKRMVAIPNSGHIKPNFLQSKFETEYFVLAMACSAILVLSALLPLVLMVYSMERTYFQMMTVLSPFFIIGGIMMARWLRARPHWIILVVLIPFFMCTTGTLNQILGYPTSMILNSAGREYEYIYVHDQDSYAAKWIKEYGKGGVMIYTHSLGKRVLQSQGKISPYQPKGSFVHLYQEGKKIDGYIYLRYSDITAAKVVIEYPDIFARKSKIYTTGVSEVYR